MSQSFSSHEIQLRSQLKPSKYNRDYYQFSGFVSDFNGGSIWSRRMSFSFILLHITKVAEYRYQYDVQSRIWNKLEKLTLTFRETGVSRQIRPELRTPIKPMTMIVLLWSEVFQGGSQLGLPWCRETLVAQILYVWSLMFFQYGPGNAPTQINR